MNSDATLTQDRKPVLLGVTWAWTAVASIFVTLRFYCRVKYQRKLWWDDWWILIASCFGLAMSIIWTVYADEGGTRHVAALSGPQIVTVTRLNWISQPFCIWGLLAGKTSVACLVARLQAPTKWRRYLLWILCSIMFVLNNITIVFIFTQCRPVYLLWNPKSDPRGNCWSPNIVSNLATASGSYLAFLDLALAAILVHMVWQLQMKLRKKVAICILLSTGVIAFIFAVVKTVQLKNDSNRSDLTWATVLLFIWNACEVNVVVVAACVPTLVPLFEVMTGRRTAAFYGKKSPHSTDYYRHATKLRDLPKQHRDVSTGSRRDMLASLESGNDAHAAPTGRYYSGANDGIEVTNQWEVVSKNEQA